MVKELDASVLETLPEEAQSVYNALLEENQNKTKALKEARSKTSELDQGTLEELESLRSFKKEQEQAKLQAEEEEAKKKGEYEKLLSEKEKALSETSEKFAITEAKAQALEEAYNGIITQQMEIIPEEKRESIQKVLDNTPIADKLAVLSEFTSLYTSDKAKSVSTKSPGKKTDVNTDSEYARAVENKDLSSVISLAPIKK